MPILESLRAAVESHAGRFLCSEINHEENKSTISFRHIGSPPNAGVKLPDVPGLKDFYETFGQLTLYIDEESGDAAFFIASPSQWPELESDFRPWIEDISEEEAEDYLPSWIDACVVVGEIPHSGNYLLVPTAGPEAGKVFEFEHDGFEFNELGSSLPEFVLKTLDLDVRRLTGIASHVRFITSPGNRQWWIDELRDNRGNSIRTEC